MENKRYKELKIAEKGAWISISAYIILAFTKIFMEYLQTRKPCVRMV